MKALFVCALCILTAGCVYEVPLATESRQEVNRQLLGLWQTVSDDGTVNTLLVLPWGDREYLVEYPCRLEDGLFFRAFVAQTGETPIMQFRLLGTAKGQLPENRSVYHYGTFRVDARELVLRLINPDVVSKDLASSAALAQAISDNREHPALFNNQTVFRRVTE